MTPHDRQPPYRGDMDVLATRRLVRRHQDVLLAVLVATAYAIELLAYPRGNDALAVPLGVAAGVGLGFRRRLPLASFVVVTVANFGVLHYAPGYDSGAVVFLVVFLLNLYSLGRHARGTEAWAGVVGLLVSIVVFVTGDGAHELSDVLFATAFCGVPWGAGVTMRLRRQREEELAAENTALEERSRRAVAEERTRIARELHDVVSHAISVTVLQSRGGRRMVGRDDEAVRRALDAIEQTNTQALSDMRRLLSLLRDADLGAEGGTDGREHPQPSLDRLDDLLRQVRQAGLPVVLDVDGDPVAVPPGVDLSAYRIVQEALTNVLKHGGPQARASVAVHYGEHDVDVCVRSTGADAVPAVSGHPGRGLLGIRERVAVVVGVIDAGPVEGGYVVRARLPYGVTA
jgi:signal transduction histidine kinase